MSVYVDDSKNKFGRMLMCHMIADTLPELHIMAVRLGLHPNWFQEDASFPHYDICQQKREKALKYGAIALDKRSLVRKIRELRGENK